MKMKCFAKNALAVTTLMIAACGMANASTVINSKDVSGEVTVKQGNTFHVDFAPNTGEIFAGKQPGDVTMFTLTMGDTAPHGGWRLIPTGDSKGGYMISADGDYVGLYSYMMSWVGIDNNWYINDDSPKDIKIICTLRQGLSLNQRLINSRGVLKSMYFK